MAIKFTDEETELLFKNGFTDEDIQYTIEEDRKNGLSDEQIQTNFNNVINKYSQDNISNYQNAYKKAKGIEISDIRNQITRDNTLSLAQKKQLYKEIKDYSNKQANKNFWKGTGKNLGQGLLGGGLMALSLHPAMNIPYVGTGASGALFSAGDAIAQGKKGNEIVGDAAQGFLIGEAVGAIPYAGKIIGKTPMGKAVANSAKQKIAQLATSKGGQAISKVANSQAVKKLQNKLAQEVKNVPEWLNYASSAESPIAKPIRNLVSKTQKLPAYAFPGLKHETVQRAINPNSKALDLSNDEAQRLLMNTTEDVRNAYNQILTDKGNRVGQLLNELPEEAMFNKAEILNDIDNIYKNYSLSNNPTLNPARNATTKQYSQINDLLNNSIYPEAVSPQELYDINKNISGMVRWDLPEAKTANDVLEQIYGQNANRISNLSPELKEANKIYSDLMDFKKNEGINTILSNRNNIDTASSKLKNYNSTVTKGNTNRNIQDLEKLLVDNGYQPFLNNIDDINAALDINNTVSTGFNPLGITQNLKNIVEKPILWTARGLNRAYQPLRNFLKPTNGAGRNLLERGLIPVATEELPLLLQGGVEMNVPYDESLNY